MTRQGLQVERQPNRETCRFSEKNLDRGWMEVIGFVKWWRLIVLELKFYVLSSSPSHWPGGVNEFLAFQERKPHHCYSLCPSPLSSSIRFMTIPRIGGCALARLAWQWLGWFSRTFSHALPATTMAGFRDQPGSILVTNRHDACFPVEEARSGLLPREKKAL